MKALLLAAGKGTRISRYLNGNPKCTVDIVGMPLIRYTVDMLHKKGISEVAIVTGYQHKVIETLLQDENVSFYYNPFFDVTNSIGSTWFAKEFFTQEDMLLMNADVFCEESIFDALLEMKANPVMLYDSSRKEEADYKFYCEDGKILKYGKELTGSDISGEYVGIAKLKADFIPCFIEKLETMISTQQSHLWWENVIYEMIGSQPVYAADIANQFWAEVDYIEDYERIMAFRKKQ